MLTWDHDLEQYVDGNITQMQNNVLDSITGHWMYVRCRYESKRKCRLSKTTGNLYFSRQ